MITEPIASGRLYKTISITTPLFSPNPNRFTFQPVPMGIVYTGTIQIISAPSYAFHQCTIGGILWAEWLGYQPSPVIQALNGEVIEVTSQGLLPQTLYQASLIGRLDNSDSYQAVWPEASLQVANNFQSLVSVTMPLTNSAFSPPGTALATGAPGQVAAIQVMSEGGTATGYRLSVVDSVNSNSIALYWTTYPTNLGNYENPWWYVPIVSQGMTLQVEPILNSVAGGTMAGIINTAILPGPLYAPYLDAAPNVGLAQTGLSKETVVINGATTTILPEPQTGTIYVVRNLMYWNSTAVTAGSMMVLQGTGSAQAYSRTFFAAATAGQAIPLANPGAFLVGNAVARADPAEGLAVNSNNAVGNIRAIVNYDQIPFSQLSNVLNI